MDWFIVTTLNLLFNTAIEHMSNDIINVLKFYYKWSEISLRDFCTLLTDVFLKCFLRTREISDTWRVETSEI